MTKRKLECAITSIMRGLFEDWAGPLELNLQISKTKKVYVDDEVEQAFAAFKAGWQLRAETEDNK